MSVLLASPQSSYHVSKSDPLLQSFFEINTSPVIYVDDAALQQWDNFLILREWMKLPLTVFESDELYKEMRGDTFGKIEEYEKSLREEKCSEEEVREYVKKYTLSIRGNPFSYEGLPSSLKIPNRVVTLAEVGRIATTLMLPSTWMYFVMVNSDSSLHERRNFYKKVGIALRTNSIGRFSQHIRRKYFFNHLPIHHNLGAWNDPAYVGSGLFFDSEETVRKTEWLSIVRGILHSALLLLLSDHRYSENRGELPIDVVRWEDVALFTDGASSWIRYLAGSNSTYSSHYPLVHLSEVARVRARTLIILYRSIEGDSDKMKPLTQKELKRIEDTKYVPLIKVLPFVYNHLINEKRRTVIKELLELQ